MERGEPISVLLVDDDSGDVELTRQSLEEAKLKVKITWLEDGDECMMFLRREGKYQDAHKPDLILLDLNMPKKDGRQVLQEIKSDQKLHRIPVVILTTSESEYDINKTYELGANCFVTKPIDLISFQKVVNEIADFWFTVVRLPQE